MSIDTPEEAGDIDELTASAPSKEELQEVEKLYNKEDFKKSVIIKSLKKEVLDDVRYIIEYACQSDVLSSKEEKRITKEMAQERENFIRMLLQSPLLLEEERAGLDLAMDPAVLHEVWRTIQNRWKEQENQKEMKKIRAQFMDYDVLREKIILSNTRLAVGVAKGYRGMGLDYAELIQEGVAGLMRGVDLYDPKRGTKLSTYVTWWIKQTIRRALSTTSRTIQLKPHVIDQLYMIRRAEDMLREMQSDKPSNEQLSDVTGLPVDRIKELKQARKSTLYIHAKTSSEDNENTTIAAGLEDSKTEDQDRKINSMDITVTIDEVLTEALQTGILPARYIEAWQRKKGLGGYPHDQSKKEIIGQMGITKERFRVYCNAVERCLQKDDRIQKLHPPAHGKLHS